MRSAYLIPILAIAAIVMLALPYGESEGATHSYQISGDVVLEEDTSYPADSLITVAPFTTIDLGGHILRVGANSSIIVLGDVSVTSANGHLVFGEKTTLTLNGLLLPVIEEGATVTFDGTMHTEVSLSGSRIHLETEGGDNVVSVSHGTATTDFHDMVVSLAPEKLGMSYKLAFTTIEEKENEIQDSEIVATKDTLIESGSPDDSIELWIDLTGFDVRKFDISKVTVTDTYRLSGIVAVTVIDGLDPVSITTTGNLKTLSISADSIIMERTVKGQLDQRVQVNDPEVSIVLDREAWLKILDPKSDPEEPPHVFRKIEVKAPSATVLKKNEEKRLTNLYAQLDGQNADYYRVLAGFDQGETEARFVANRVNMKSFSISFDLIANLTVDIDKITITVEDPEQQQSSAVIEDVVLGITGFDIMRLYSSYAKAGDVGPQEILDCCSKFEFDASGAKVSAKGEKPMDAELSAISAELLKDTRGINTMSVDADEAVIDTVYGGSTVHAVIDDLMLYIASNGSLSEVVDALMSSIHFTTDSATELEIGVSKVTVQMDSEDTDTVIVLDKASKTAPKQANCTGQLVYSTYSDTTTLSVNLSLLGYILSMEVHKNYTDPEGTLDLKLSGKDVSGAASFGFGGGISYSASLYIPWSLDLDYYGIDVETDGTDTTLTVSHGALDVNGYDYVTDGILNILPALHEGDFDTSLRVSLNDSLLQVYKDKRATDYNTYRNVDIECKLFSLGVHPGQPNKISFDRISLELIDKEGKAYNRDIEHLDIATKDDAPDALAEYAEMLFYAFVAASFFLVLALIGLRIRKPHLFKFNEFEDDERSGPGGKLRSNKNRGHRPPVSTPG